MSIDNEKVRMHRLPIYRVTLVRESSQSSMLNRITTPRNVFEIASSYLEGADREHFVVIMLDTKNQVIGINTVAIGVLASCPIHPREVFKPAILANAAGVILLHNQRRSEPVARRFAVDEQVKRSRGGSGDSSGGSCDSGVYELCEFEGKRADLGPFFEEG
jgi:DNA repair protein RadC